ncbi:MAG: hypothetical protein ACYCQJ_03360 [Nitrososphaerales archaeon]
MERAKTVEDDLVNDVFQLDTRIRFVGVIDNEGNLVSGGMRPGTVPLEPNKADENKLYLKWFLMEAMTNEWNRFLGKKILLYTRHEKLDMYGFTLKNSKVLLVSAEHKKTSFFGDKILDLVDSHNL